MVKKNMKLDKEEKEILAEIDRGEYRSIPNLAEERKRLAKIARNTLAKNKIISIRISNRDLLRIKAKTAEERMPYQTLISSTSA